MKLYRIFGALSLLSLVALPACGAQSGADDESDSDQGALKNQTDAGGGTAAGSPVTKRFAGSLTVGSTELKVELSATASAPSTSAAKVARDNDSHVCMITLASDVTESWKLTVSDANGRSLASASKSATVRPDHPYDMRGHDRDTSCEEEAAFDARMTDDRRVSHLQYIAGRKTGGGPMDFGSSFVDGLVVDANGTTIHISAIDGPDGMGPQGTGAKAWNPGVGLDYTMGTGGSVKSEVFSVNGELKLSWPSKIDIPVGIAPSGDPERAELVYQSIATLSLRPVE
jgi:hypothetical protein